MKPTGMIKFAWILAGLLASLSLAALVACGPANSAPTHNPSVSLGTIPNPPPSSLIVNGGLSLEANVNNDTSGVTWSCTPGNTAATCGSFTPASSASGTPVQYTAPNTVPSAPVVITATLNDNSGISASTSSITIVGITVTLSAPPPASLAVNASVTIAATTNAPNGVGWSCTPANNCGAFVPPITASGGTTLYTAPPNGGNVVVTAAAVNENDYVSATVDILPPPPSLANGNYVFSLVGSDGDGTYSVVGAFTIVGGAIIGGEQDLANFSLYEHDAITGGGAVIRPDGNVLITITTADDRIGVDGVETLDATVVSPSKALLTEFDTSATASGELDLQTTSLSTPVGSYAFFTAGVGVGEKPVSLGGVIDIDSTGDISSAGSVFDISDDGVPLAAQTFASGSVGTPDSFGLVDFTLTPSAASGVGRIVLTGYVIDASHIRLIEQGSADVFRGTTSGTALGQTGTGNFNAGSLSASSYVIAAAGSELPGAQQLASVLTFNSDGTVSGTLSFNDLKTPTPQGGSTLAAGATYPVASTGDVTVTGLNDGTAVPTFTYNLQLYLTGDGHALLISMDSAEVLAGRGFLQSGAPFTAASFSGSYALNFVQKLPIPPFEQDGVGPVAANGVSALTGFVDLNEESPTSDVPLTGTFTPNANGVFTGTISGISSIAGATSEKFTYYVADPTQIVAIETDLDQLTLGYFELQQ
jgi:hypothetical protein